MKFTKSLDPLDGDAWYSGIYKIVRYEKDTENKGRRAYYAYYKPRGWENWGNHVDRGTPLYQTLKDATAACVHHAEQANHD